MTMKKLKRILKKHGKFEYQLCKILNINRTTLTEWSHYDGFKGHERAINHGLHQLLSE